MKRLLPAIRSAPKKLTPGNPMHMPEGQPIVTPISIPKVTISAGKTRLPGLKKGKK